MNGFTEKTWAGFDIELSDYNTKCLNIIIPNEVLSIKQENALQQAKDFAANLNIIIKVYITK